MEASEEIVSTSSSAGWPAASRAARTARMRLVTPVEVSLCTTATALIVWPRSSARRASIRSGSAPVRQSPSRTSTSRPSRRAIAVHSVEKCPVSHISTVSPGESVFTSAASHAPVPEDGKISTSPRVRKISRRPASTRMPSRPNSGPRWSMVARSMARRIRPGTLVGPGIWRKWRPAGVLMVQRPSPLHRSPRSEGPFDDCDHNRNAPRLLRCGMPARRPSRERAEIPRGAGRRMPNGEMLADGDSFGGRTAMPCVIEIVSIVTGEWGLQP